MGMVPTKCASVQPTGAIKENGDAAIALYGKAVYVAGSKGLSVFERYADADPSSFRRYGELINTEALSDQGGASLAIDGNRLFVAGGKGLAEYVLDSELSPFKVGVTMN